ncbi:MAG: hypothetical protein Q4E12_07650 [Coriobacteriia bacterium]|nr:hypothetical protein [Coriobacteriia bacterium]
MALSKTYSRFKKHGHRLLVGALIVIILAAAIYIGYSLAQTSLKAQGAESLRNSILESAKQCAAIEGAYPSSLKHLEDDYGLVLNYNDYTINYEVFASNVMPTVTVVPK